MKRQPTSLRIKSKRYWFIKAYRNKYGVAKLCNVLDVSKNEYYAWEKCLESQMNENGIRSRVSNKYKATTNSNHKLPIYENILNRDFTVDKPNKKNGERYNLPVDR